MAVQVAIRTYYEAKIVQRTPSEHHTLIRLSDYRRILFIIEQCIIAFNNALPVPLAEKPSGLKYNFSTVFLQKICVFATDVVVLVSGLKFIQANAKRLPITRL